MIFKIKDKRLCRNCANFKESKKKLTCKILGKIKFPDHPYCSWYKGKEEKVNDKDRR